MDQKTKTGHITALAVVGLVLLSSIAVGGVGGTATTTSTSDLGSAENATQSNSTTNSSDINWTKPLRLQEDVEELNDLKEPSPDDGTPEPTPQASKEVSDSDDTYETEEGNYLHLDSDISGTWTSGTYNVKYEAGGSDVLSWPSSADLEYVSITSTATANGIEPKLSPSSGFLSVSSLQGEFDRTWNNPGDLDQPRVAHEYEGLTASSSFSLTGVAIDTVGEVAFSWRSVQLHTDMNAAP